MEEKTKRGYWQAYVDAWKLLHYFLDHGNSEEEQKNFVEMSYQLCQKHEGHVEYELAGKLMEVTIGEVRKLVKEETV